MVTPVAVSRTPLIPTKDKTHPTIAKPTPIQNKTSQNLTPLPPYHRYSYRRSLELPAAPPMFRGEVLAISPLHLMPGLLEVGNAVAALLTRLGLLGVAHDPSQYPKTPTRSKTRPYP